MARNVDRRGFLALTGLGALAARLADVNATDEPATEVPEPESLHATRDMRLWQLECLAPLEYAKNYFTGAPFEASLLVGSVYYTSTWRTIEVGANPERSYATVRAVAVDEVTRESSPSKAVLQVTPLQVGEALIRA